MSLTSQMNSDGSFFSTEVKPIILKHFPQDHIDLLVTQLNLEVAQAKIVKPFYLQDYPYATLGTAAIYVWRQIVDPSLKWYPESVAGQMASSARQKWIKAQSNIYLRAIVMAYDEAVYREGDLLSNLTGWGYDEKHGTFIRNYLTKFGYRQKVMFGDLCSICDWFDQITIPTGLEGLEVNPTSSAWSNLLGGMDAQQYHDNLLVVLKTSVKQKPFDSQTILKWLAYYLFFYEEHEIDTGVVEYLTDWYPANKPTLQIKTYHPKLRGFMCILPRHKQVVTVQLNRRAIQEAVKELTKLSDRCRTLSSRYQELLTTLSWNESAFDDFDGYLDFY